MSNPLVQMVETLRAQYSEDQTDELTKAIQLELAAAIALILPVPAVAYGNTNQAWVNHNVFINRLLDDVNELYLLDLPEVKANVKAIYEVRYNFVHNPTGTIEATNAIVKFLAGRGGEGEFSLRDLTTQTVKGLADSALELQKQYVAETTSSTTSE